MAGEGDILSGAGSGAATGAMVGGPWGAVAGGAIGLANGIFKYLGNQEQAQAMRAQQAEALRRKRLEDAQILGQAAAAGAASGIDFESTSLQNYLGSMKAEMARQLAAMRRAGATNASNVSAAGTYGLVSDLGSTLSSFAKDNNYWRSTP